MWEITPPIHTYASYKGTHLRIGHSVAWTQETLVPSGNIIWELVHLLLLLGCCLIIHNSILILIYSDIQLSNPSLGRFLSIMIVHLFCE